MPRTGPTSYNRCMTTDTLSLDRPDRFLGWLARGRPQRPVPGPRRAARASGPVQPVRLADGHDAWLVLGHEAVRVALMDPRFSKDMVTALADDPDVVDPGLPGPALARHMMNLDPPDHTRLRRLAARAFLPSRIAAAGARGAATRRRPARRPRRGRDPTRSSTSSAGSRDRSRSR